MGTPPAMTADFARWYADSFMDTGEVRDLRWKGVIDVSNEPSLKTIEVLVRLAFPSNAPAAGLKNEALAETYTTVVSMVSGGDATFNASQSARELQVLAAAALSNILPQDAGAAISIITASFNGARNPDLPMDLLGLAQKALIALSSRQHLRPAPETLQRAAPKLNFAVSAEAMQAMEAARWSAELERLCDSTSAALAAMVDEQNRVTGMLQRQITLDEEELQILWWLIGGFSRHLDMPFNDIDREMRPLCVAGELGEMTKVLPGPASIGALLTRAGVGVEECTVEEVVNAVNIDWAKQVSASASVSPVTTPLHFALEKRGELGSDIAWQPGWAGLTGIRVDFSMPAVRMAELFYREHLLLHVDP